MIAFSGVRISWLMFATNSLLERAAAASSRLTCSRRSADSCRSRPSASVPAIRATSSRAENGLIR